MRNGISPSVSNKQREDAEEIAENFDFNFETIETEEMENPNYQSNPTNRCYHCKTELYEKLSHLAKKKEIDLLWMVQMQMMSAIIVREEKPQVKRNVKSPLIEVGLTKDEIRELSMKHDLPTWDQTGESVSFFPNRLWSSCYN